MNKFKYIYNFIIRFMLVIIITFLCLIGFKKDSSFKSLFYNNVLNNNFSFVSVNNYYKKIFGSPIPFSDFFLKKESSVFNEKLNYNSLSSFLDGVILDVDYNYLVPSISNGMVIFIGDKDDYKNSIIVLQDDGVEVWYSNLNSNVLLYDYVEKGDFIGSCIDDKLYLNFKKNGISLDYNDYI